MAEKITVPGITKMKHQGKKITCLTAYDYSFARILDEAVSRPVYGYSLWPCGPRSTKYFIGDDG